MSESDILRLQEENRLMRIIIAREWGSLDSADGLMKRVLEEEAEAHAENVNG